MADPRKRVPENVEGDFFVDSTCIDCDTCRQLAPSVFEDSGRTSYVRAQPRDEGELRAASRALLACPTGSIGTAGPNLSREAMGDFPLPIGDGVHLCGFNSPKSFGGNSYLILRPEGNWLVDSPKFLPHLVRKFEEAGGLRTIFLTHRDDVADAELWANRFHARRIIHEEDRSAQPRAEVLLRGSDPVEIEPGLTIIPTPGHTRGHCVLLYRRKFLFSGDHLWWRRKRLQLGAGEDVAWYSWGEQARSMEKLLHYDFEWVLPGHGDRKWLPAGEMRRELEALVTRMKSTSAD